MTFDVRIVNLCIGYYVKIISKTLKRPWNTGLFYCKFFLQKVLTFYIKYLSYILPLRKESPLLTKIIINNHRHMSVQKIKRWKTKKPEARPLWTDSTALRRHETVWLNRETARPSLPAASARLAEVGPIKSPLENNSAPSTATAKKTKAWTKSRSCLAQASVRNGKRAISKSPAPAFVQARRQIIIE